MNAFRITYGSKCSQASLTVYFFYQIERNWYFEIRFYLDNKGV
jgi:hypothetical protein